jgi:hypothetical protein
MTEDWASFVIVYPVVLTGLQFLNMQKLPYAIADSICTNFDPIKNIGRFIPL